MVVSKNQAIIATDVKLCTNKMGKDFHAYICRLYIVAVDLELCIFRNRCQQINAFFLLLKSAWFIFSPATSSEGNWHA